MHVLNSFPRIIYRTKGSCGPDYVTGCYCSLIGRCGRFCRSFDVLRRSSRGGGTFHLVLSTGMDGIVHANVTLLNVRMPREVWKRVPFRV